ncbi:MAG TPA: hypothetical protein VGO11_20485 [Chthoniobacteraceae bacterium]|jgi:hypothetical protein|nr:hypothetical protein [Chthoniobacteraceae bacterium]
MNFSSLLAIGASGLSLVLGLWLFISGMLSGSQQGRWQDQQQELLNHQTEFAKLQQQAQIQQQNIRAGQQLEQQGKVVLNEIGAATLPPKNNEKLKTLLAHHKITVQPPEKPAATPASTAPAVRPPSVVP